MHTSSAIAAALLFSALACACSPADRPPAAASSEQPVAAAAEVPVAAPRPEPSAIRAEPAALPNCNPGTKVGIVWDARKLDGVTTVDIVAVNRQGRETLFFTGGRMGRKETGSWMQSGSQLVLRNHADGSELGRTAIAGTPCVDGVPVAAGPGKD